MSRGLGFFALVALLVGPLAAEKPAPTAAEVHKQLTGVTGKVELPGGVAVLNLEDGNTYLNPAQTQFLLEKVWKNPDGSGFLGAVIPRGFGEEGESQVWAALISYEDSGHVKDDDAASMNYDDLLKQMREGVAERNKDRKEKGFEEITLVGWATPPHYDSGAKTVYWARELSFGGSETHTLNYEIRVLGRQGVLDINVVAGLPDLKTVEAATPGLLNQVGFQGGQRYADYQDGTDHLAEYGVAGLILGGIALKAGLLKVILVALAASWKFILIGLAAVGAFLVRFFKNKKKNTPAAGAEDPAQDPPAQP